MLSDKDIEEMIPSRKLFIGPFDPNCLTPIGYSLRVGEKALSLRKKIARKEVDVEKLGEVVIDPRDTVAIWTLESIRLSKELGGVVHAKVSKASLGLFHIAAPVHPGWGEESEEGAPFLVYVHNYSDEVQVLRYKEPFCTLCLFKMQSPAIKPHGRESARIEEWDKLCKRATLRARASYISRRTWVIAISVGVLLAIILTTAFDVLPKGWGIGIGSAAALFAVIWTIIQAWGEIKK